MAWHDSVNPAELSSKIELESNTIIDAIEDKL